MVDLSSTASCAPGASMLDAATASWFIANCLDLFVIVDFDGLILETNPAWLTTLGWRAEEVRGRLMRSMVHPDDLHSVIESGRQVRTEGSARYISRIATRDGGWRWVEGVSNLTADRRLVAVLRDMTADRARVEELEALRAAQELLSEAAGVANWKIDPDTLSFDHPYNFRRLTAKTGFDLDSVETLSKIVHPDDWPNVAERLLKATVNGGEGEMTVRLMQKSGEQMHFRVSYRTEPHPSGRFTVHGMSQNMTEVVEARDAALQGQRTANQMVEAAPFAVALFDLSLKHTVASPLWCAMFGRSEDDILGRSLTDLTTGARRRLLSAQRRALSGETVTRAQDEITFADGESLWVRWEMHPRRDSAGQVCGVMAYLGDISGLVDARRQAQASARRLKLAVRAADAAVFEIDYAAKTFWMGPDFIRVAGRSLTYDEALQPWPHTHPDDVAPARAAIAAWDSRKPMPLEGRVIGADGLARWVRVYIDVKHDSYGRPLKGVGLVLDIDERKRQELKLATAERQATVATEAKSQFLANISHEIRTPMNGVLGVLQLLQRRELAAADRSLLEEALTSGRMLTELLDDLLDFSKIETGQFHLNPEPLDPAAVLLGVASLLEPAASAKGLSLKALADPELGMIEADPLRLRQALYNLMGNAVKFTPAGSIEARLTRRETPEGTRLRFEVQDTGVGVPEEAQATLFERFEQADGSASRKFGGSGLGLAITKRLAEKMGGAVGFSSAPGEGSTFWIEIEGVVAEAPPAANDEQGEDIGAFRVLLVEDNPTNRLVISKLLEALGIQVETAEDGAAGVAAAATGGFDMVLMDIQMPGMDGMEATRRIRAMDGPAGQIPVVAVTANVLAHQRTSYEAAGMDGVVAKPVSAAALFSEISRVAERRAA